MPETSSTRTRDLGILALVLLGPIWGYGWVATKVALDYSDALTFAALRVPLSAALLFAVMIVLRKPLRPPPLGWTMLIGLLQTTLFVGLVITALHDAGAGKVSVLTYTMPFWLLLLAWLFLGERLRGVQWLAVALAFAGLVLVVRPWAFADALAGVLTVLGGLSWAASALVVKLMQRRHTVEVLSLTTWQMVFGSIPLVIAAVLTYSGGPRVDVRLLVGARLHGGARQRRRLVPLAVRAARAAGRRRRSRDAVDPGRRRGRGLAAARRGADARGGHRHGAHHRGARSARRVRPAERPRRSRRRGARRAAGHRLMDRRGRDLGALALALLALIWGYNWVVMKVGLQYAQPFTFSALRTFLGALSLFALLLVLRRSLRPPPLGWTLVIGLLQTTGFVGLLMWALESGGAGKTSVLTYTMPFWLLLLAWAFLGERLRGVQWVAVALALAGLVLVLAPWRPRREASAARWPWPAGSAGRPAPWWSSASRPGTTSTSSR